MSTENENLEGTTPVSPPTPIFAPNSGYIAPPVAPAVSITDWIITFFLLMIPVVGIILLFVWAFGNDTNPSKANFAKAYLIIYLVFAVLAVLFMIFFGAAMWALLQNQGTGLE